MWRSISLLSFAVALAAQETISVTGTLNHVMAIGGESTGWALQLDAGTKVAGRVLSELEVSSPRQAELRKWNGKRVRVSGSLTTRTGVERGSRTVLEIVKIQAATAEAGIVGTRWVLEDLAGVPAIEASRPTLDFVSAVQVAGDTSCNKFGGAAKFDGDKLKLGPMRVTRKACAPELMKQEAEILRAMEAVDKWELREGKLYLTGPDFEKALRYSARSK
jgi:putative lipoprotein